MIYMADTLNIRFLRRAGDPRSGVIIQPGTVCDFPTAWANRYIAQGIAEVVVRVAEAIAAKKPVVLKRQARSRSKNG